MIELHPTAEDVLDGIDLRGKTVLITGASGGLGEESARAFAACGASVTITGRTSAKLAGAVERIKAITNVRVEAALLELDKPDPVRVFARAWLAMHPVLDLLINNAGVMCTPFERSAEGWEKQFATNHLGHFLLTNSLQPAMRSGTRVVNLTSSGHWYSPVDLEDPGFNNRSYDPWVAYGQSKTANIWFTLELDRRLRSGGVRSFAVHPGGIYTQLGRHLSAEQVSSLGEMASKSRLEFKTLSQGAATSCWAATSLDLEGMGGLYLEDCKVSAPGKDMFSGGYAPYAFNVDGAAELWRLSNRLLGTDH